LVNTQAWPDACTPGRPKEHFHETGYSARVLLLQTGSMLLQGWRMLLLQQ